MAINMAEAKPKPGMLVVSYIALSKGRISGDTGAGKLEGSGTGTIIFATGSAAINLDALPDPDSAIVFSYVAQNGAKSEDDWTSYEIIQNVAKQISDDTAVGWRGVTGVIDYQTGAFTVLALEDYDYPEFATISKKWLFRVGSTKIA